jgi:acyl dehydratase
VTVEVGTRFPARTFQVTRADLIRYAGASLDFNPIHWSERVATSVGLPGVIAHGMLTMALAGQALAEWIGDTGAIVEYGVSFTNPVPVPDDDVGTEIVVEGVVKKLTDDGLAQVDISAVALGQKVLGQARALIRAQPPPTA